MFGDVFVRRVALDYAYPIKWVAKRLNPDPTAKDNERSQSLQRLRSKKTEVSGEMEQAKASVRFEADEPAGEEELEQEMRGTASKPRTAAQPSGPNMSQKDDQEGYTSRPLAAKRAAQKKGQDQPPGEN